MNDGYCDFFVAVQKETLTLGDISGWAEKRLRAPKRSKKRSGKLKEKTKSHFRTFMNRINFMKILKQTKIKKIRLKAFDHLELKNAIDTL